MSVLRRKRAIAEGFHRYCRRLLSQRFDGVALLADCAPAWVALGETPRALLYSSHASWWDVIVGGYLALACKLELYAPMDIDQLSKYWILRSVGIFGVSETKPIGYLRALREIFEVSDTRSLLITPQAHFATNHLPSPPFRRGLTLAAERYPKVPLFAVTMHYDLWNESRPVVLLGVTELDRTALAECSTSEERERFLRLELDTLTARVVATSHHRDDSEWNWLIRSKARTLGLQDITGRIRAAVHGERYHSGHLR